MYSSVPVSFPLSGVYVYLAQFVLFEAANRHLVVPPSSNLSPTPLPLQFFAFLFVFVFFFFYFVAAIFSQLARRTTFLFIKSKWASRGRGNGRWASVLKWRRSDNKIDSFKCHFRLDDGDDDDDDRDRIALEYI